MIEPPLYAKQFRRSPILYKLNLYDMPQPYIFNISGIFKLLQTTLELFTHGFWAQLPLFSLAREASAFHLLMADPMAKTHIHVQVNTQLTLQEGIQDSPDTVKSLSIMQTFLRYDPGDHVRAQYQCKSTEYFFIKDCSLETDTDSKMFKRVSDE